MDKNTVLFLGPPSAGKSTLIGRIQKSRYSTTLPTLVPHRYQFCLPNDITVELLDTPGDLIKLVNLRKPIESAKIVVICISKNTQSEFLAFEQVVAKYADQDTLVLLALLQFAGQFQMPVNNIQVLKIDTDNDVSALRKLISTTFTKPEPEPEPAPQLQLQLIDNEPPKKIYVGPELYTDPRQSEQQPLVPNRWLNDQELLPNRKQRKPRWVIPVVVVSTVVVVAAVAVLATKLANVW